MLSERTRWMLYLEPKTEALDEYLEIAATQASKGRTLSAKAAVAMAEVGAAETKAEQVVKRVYSTEQIEAAREADHCADEIPF